MTQKAIMELSESTFNGLVANQFCTQMTAFKLSTTDWAIPVQDALLATLNSRRYQRCSEGRQTSRAYPVLPNPNAMLVDLRMVVRQQLFSQQSLEYLHELQPNNFQCRAKQFSLLLLLSGNIFPNRSRLCGKKVRRDCEKHAWGIAFLQQHEASPQEVHYPFPSNLNLFQQRYLATRILLLSVISAAFACFYSLKTEN